MPMTRRSLALALLAAACSSSEPAAPPTPAPAPEPTSTATPLCGVGSKVCEGRCTPASLPETGCAGASCAPCDLAHASARCSSEGKCIPAACENGFGDCDARADNGCEVDLTQTDAHCGACGKSCTATQVCRRSSCVDRNVAAAETWLSTQTEGWCSDTYNQMINLCGDAEFCFDARYMRSYPTGIAVDIGFDWESLTDGGNLAAMGGDCDGQSLGLGVRPLGNGGLLEAFGFQSSGIEVAITRGKHLVSYQVSTNGTALFVDGLRVGVGRAPATEIKLRDACGPGLVLGGRLSFWWEANQRPAWLQYAPFYVQLREGVPDASDYSVDRATTAGAGTVLRFDKSGAVGATWKASVGSLVGVAKNTLDGTAQIDAGASGPLPAWKPLGSCSLK